MANISDIPRANSTVPRQIKISVYFYKDLVMMVAVPSLLTITIRANELYNFQESNQCNVVKA